MFQRLSNLLFGEVEAVSAAREEPRPCISDSDEDGWLLVSLPGNDCALLGEGGAEVPSIAQSLPPTEFKRAESECEAFKRTCDPAPSLCDPAPSLRDPAPSLRDPAPSLCKSRRTRADRPLAACPSSPSPCPAPCLSSPSPGVSVGVNVLSSHAHWPRGSTPLSPGSRGDGCSGGLESGRMDESWFVTPPPCFTAEGAPAQASPMEDLLIEHPSMSVYVSSGNFSVVEHTAGGMADSRASLSAMSESAQPPVVMSTMPTRMARGAARQALAKVTQASRVQRAKARVERRPLSLKRMQRQNHAREQIPRHARKSILHQPCHRSLCH